MKLSVLRNFSLCLFFLLNTEGFAQLPYTRFDLASSHALTTSTKPNYVLPFKIVDVKFSNSSDTIGLLGKRKRKEKQWIVYPNREENVLKAIQSQFEMTENGSKIKLRIEQFDIHSVQENEVTPEDTFYYRCTFVLLHPGESDEELFHFKGKNLMGATELAEEAFHHYAWRNITQSIHQFTTSFRSTPQWDILKDTSSSMVQTQFLLNSNLGIDSLPCRADTKLDSSFFNQKTTKDSSQAVGHCRLILTYAILAEERSGKLFLTVHSKSFVSKNRSWIKPGQVNEDWYTYQQGHVILCGFYGRKLQSEFQKTTFTYGEYKTQANQAYNKVYEEYVKLRKQYADETLDGKDAMRMKEWQAKLLEMNRN